MHGMDGICNAAHGLAINWASDVLGESAHGIGLDASMSFDVKCLFDRTDVSPLDIFVTPYHVAPDLTG